MAAPAHPPTSITPASLSYLAIYNPSLGPTDETLPDQIVFWTSRSPVSQNECLRQIGLAQGIVEFSRGFSGSQDLNTVETQKSRIVLHQIEPGWWILASIDITQIHYATDPPTTDYSPREVAPSSVLISQLKTSYRQFLLFNGTLESVLAIHGRDVLLQRLERFYTRWAWRWEVMLNGNPALDIWNGIKIGRGVGDEEKEVLGDFVDRNRKEKDGSERLIDVVVSRFGKLPGAENSDRKIKPSFSSRGTGRLPGPDDGCIYRGAGNLAKESVRDISEWMARWYQYGDSSFDYQTTRPSRRKHRRHKSKASSSQSSQPKSSAARTSTVELSTAESAAGPSEGSTPAGTETTTPESGDAQSPGEPDTRLPPPLLLEPGWQPQKPQTRIASKTGDRSKTAKPNAEAREPNPASIEQASDPKGSNNKLMLNVLTLGTYAAYSAWNRTREDQEQSKNAAPEVPTPEPNPVETPGRFITGYIGPLDDEQHDEQAVGDTQVNRKEFLSTTIWVQRHHQQADDSIQESEENPDKPPMLEECRLVAYAAYPFIFAMLFHPTNESLNKPGFYKLLNQQLGPLKGPLISSSEKHYQPSHSKGLYDLIFDPATLTIHSSIPNIPDPMLSPSPTPTTSDPTNTGGLPRIEALHIHSQVIRVIEDTRWKEIPLGAPSGERERTNRTTRGWWVAWMRLDSAEAQPRPAARKTNSGDTQELVPPEDDIASFIGSVSKQRRGRREAFIVKKGSDHRTHVRATKDSKGGFAIPIKLSGGLGIDTKRYFDQLLNLTART
ncbi:hypothetical protein TWF696_000705 [Orbilia brochopaga]|uniref:CCZ1/INTU/HSP4 first Longin domain-containing protein n=1 Tax=Orbilia brochopaga TaxID=3140254 RepID=A0AAV9VDN0_9PEZI